MCRDHHQHSELFQDINRIHDEKYNPSPRWFMLSSITFLPSPTQTCSYNFGNTSFLACRWIVVEPVGHTLIFSLLKLYDLFSRLFPMDPWCIQSQTFAWNHVNAISKHVCGNPISNKNIWSTILKFLYQLSKHRCMGNVMKFLSPYLNGFILLSCHGYHALFVLSEGYTPEMCV